MKNKKFIFGIVIVLLIQILLPVSLLWNNYSLHQDAQEYGVEYKFKLVYISYYDDEIRFSIDKLSKFYKRKVKVREGENGIAVLSEVQDGERVTNYFNETYVNRMGTIDDEEIVFAEGMDKKAFYNKIRTFIRLSGKERDKYNIYMTAKVYRGVFIPTAIYFEDELALTINKEKP